MTCLRQLALSATQFPYIADNEGHSELASTADRNGFHTRMFFFPLSYIQSALLPSLAPIPRARKPCIFAQVRSEPLPNIGMAVTVLYGLIVAAP